MGGPHRRPVSLTPVIRTAHIDITLFFADREPAGPYRITVKARRTLHLRFNNLTDPEPVPLETDYSSVIFSDAPIVVQHTISIPDRTRTH